MSREIKFRAWLPDWKEIVKVTHIEFDDDSNLKYIYYKRQNDIVGGTPDFDLIRYTGLKDKNGKEIYEGDLVLSERGYKTSTAIGVVSWYDGYCGFQVDFKDEGPLGRLDERLEVIGNIYESPELLS